MKLPEPRQKQNGKWLVQVSVDGKRLGKTFDTREEAVYWAAGIKTKMQEAKTAPGNMTVGQMIDRYIENGGSFSPSTVAGYKKLRRNTFSGIMDVNLANLTQDQIQREVSRMAADGKAAKYIASAHGLLSAAMKKYYPAFHLTTMLPQKEKKEISIPSDEEVAAILRAAKGTDSELPISLAAWLGLRASEISGLTWNCIQGDAIHIKQARVHGEDGLYLKKPKTYSGDRVIHVPAPLKSLLDAAPRKSEFVVPLSPHAIYARFSRICEKAGVRHYRLHDLRHYNASVMIANNVPMKYIIERMGHASDNMVKNVYAHVMQPKKEEYAAAVESYLQNAFNKNAERKCNRP